MSVSSYNSVNTFNDVTSSQFVQCFNIDYYSFRHVVNKANIIEVKDYPDCNASVVPSFQAMQQKYNQQKSNNTQNFQQNQQNSNVSNQQQQQDQPIQYFEQISLPQQNQSKDFKTINMLQQSKRQLDTNQQNISNTLNAIKDDQVFMGQYGQQLKEIQHKNKLLWQQNQKLLQELENVKEQINDKNQQQISLQTNSFIQDFNQYKNEIKKINTDLEDLKKSKQTQKDNVFLQSITSQKNIPSDQKKSQRDIQINFLLSKIENLEQKINQNNSNQHNCANCQTCQKKDKTIQYLKQFLNDSSVQNIPQNSISNNNFNNQQTNFQTQNSNTIRNSFTQANFNSEYKQNFSKNEYGSFKEGTTVIDQDGQQYPRGTSIGKYRNQQGNRVTEIRTPPKLKQTYIDNEKRYNFQQKYPIYQSQNSQYKQQPIRYSISNNSSQYRDVQTVQPKVTYIKHDGSRQSYIKNSNYNTQQNTNNIMNGSRRSSTFEDYYKTQNGIRTSKVINNHVNNAKENIQVDEYGINMQQSQGKQSQQNSELFSNKDQRMSEKNEENLGMMSFGIINSKQNNLNFHGSKNLIKNVYNTDDVEQTSYQKNQDLHNQSDDIMNVIQTKTLNRILEV